MSIFPMPPEAQTEVKEFKYDHLFTDETRDMLLRLPITDDARDRLVIKLLDEAVENQKNQTDDGKRKNKVVNRMRDKLNRIRREQDEKETKEEIMV